MPYTPFTPIPNKLAAGPPPPEVRLFLRNEEDLITLIRKAKDDLSRAETRLTNLYIDYPELSARYASGLYYGQYMAAGAPLAVERAPGEG